MRNMMLLLFIALLFSSCGENSKNEKNIKDDNSQSTIVRSNSTYEIIVDSVVTIPLKDNYYNPSFLSDDELIVTQSGHIGLFKINLATAIVDTLSTSRGAGFDYTFYGNKIYYIRNEYVPTKLKRYYFLESFDPNGGLKKNIYQSELKIYSLDIIKNYLTWIERDALKVYDINTDMVLSSVQFQHSKYIISGMNLKSFQNNKMEIIKFSDKNNLLAVTYVDDENIFVEIAGEGFYSYSFKDSVKKFIGNYFSAKYSAVNNSIAYVVEQNDGHMITSSEIGIKNLDRAYDKLLTELGTDAENPTWSKDASKIIFNTLKGRIKIAYLSYK